jgi:hypothetical protein
MKKLILTTTFLVAGILGSLAQGVVNFNNLGFNYTDGIDRRVYLDSIGGTPVTSTAYSATLLQDGVAVGGPQAFLGTSAPGQWLFANRTLRTPAGEAANLSVQIASGGNVVATSPVFTYAPPTDPAAPASAFLMTNFRAFAVPEPSTIALGVLGLGALLLFRRRK